MGLSVQFIKGRAKISENLQKVQIMTGGSPYYSLSGRLLGIVMLREKIHPDSYFSIAMGFFEKEKNNPQICLSTESTITIFIAVIKYV